MSRAFTCVAAAGLAVSMVCVRAAQAQSRFLINDRTNHAIWSIDDANGNGTIDEPGELSAFFTNGNQNGTLAINNPTCLAVRTDGLTLMGDQGNRCIYLINDLNHDGSADGIGESVVAADASNASGVSFAFPTGAAFDRAGAAYVVNAGNGFGSDAIYKLIDLDGDGRFQSAGEVSEYVGSPALGPGNGPFSPQEMVFDFSTSPLVGFLHDSGAMTHGVYRFVDQDGNGRADDPGEFGLFFGVGNASGISPSAGFALTLDAARPGSLYMLQTATGPTHQLIRLTDSNGDGDAQDAGEALVAWSTSESGFVEIAVVSLADGRVLITDNSGKRVIVLTDIDGDGLFTGAGERATYFANAQHTVGDLRQMYPIARFCQANCDGSTNPPVLNVNDFTCFLNRFSAGDLYANCDGSSTPPVLNVNDFTCFINRFAAGCH